MKRFLVLGLTGFLMIVAASYLFITINKPQKLQDTGEAVISQVPEAGFSQRSSGNGVDINVELANPSINEKDNNLIFKVVFTTHSGDLTTFPIENSIVLTNGENLNINSGFVWEVKSNDPHHRSGYLKLLLTDEIRTKIANSSSITLIVKNLADIPERELKWDKEIIKKLADSI